MWKTADTRALPNVEAPVASIQSGGSAVAPHLKVSPLKVGTFLPEPNIVTHPIVVNFFDGVASLPSDTATVAPRCDTMA